MTRLASAVLSGLAGITVLSTLSVTEAANALPAWRGNQRALVVLVEWSDQAGDVTVDEMHKTFFDDAEGAKSLRSFFLENSGGTFNMTGDIMNWRQSPKRWNSANGCSLGPIVNEAWNLFRADIDVASYDSDGNGKIDNLFVIHSGRINQDRVGPECTFVTDSRSDHSVVFQAHGIGSIGTAIPIGFYIHEGGHGYYNLPDLYADHYNGRYGIGMWGMMGLGAWGLRNDIDAVDLFRYPAHFEPLSKVRIGWTSPRVINRTTRDVLITPVEDSPDIVAVPRTTGSNYYLEYRSPKGWSEGHHGHGLLIWRDYAIIQADGRDDINNGTPQGRRPLPPITENFGDDSDPFPGTANVTSYRDTRYGITFENIRVTEEGVLVDIIVTNEDLPYTESVTPNYTGEERL